MRTVEATGRTIEEAVAAALAELEADRSQVEIEVLDEGTKGLFGIIGSKQARVRVTRVVTPEDKARRVASWLEEAARLMGVDAEASWQMEDESIRVNLSGEGLGLLIGRRGQTLDALQYLAGMVGNKDGGPWLRVLVDAEGYRERREESLRGLALRSADKARRNGRRVVLEPMNAHERRIIHISLQDEEGVSTYSEGVEPYRRVVISPR
ncbi:MAG: RNA-binding cell elongation regulator Jag/EloR [Limnochordia bacterium]|jgi:spoIIIJ-associated protein|nr:protein jag [Bacillota bacterium]